MLTHTDKQTDMLIAILHACTGGEVMIANDAAQPVRGCRRRSCVYRGLECCQCERACRQVSCRNEETGDDEGHEEQIQDTDQSSRNVDTADAVGTCTYKTSRNTLPTGQTIKTCLGLVICDSRQNDQSVTLPRLFTVVVTPTPLQN